ncbi:small acid-soluble spore protein Tlp [Bacillus paralicheniformis]
MTHQKHHPDDRSDNVEKLQDMVQNTIENIEESEEQLSFANQAEQEQIREKNQRRNVSIEAMRNEIHDEAEDRENGYHQ